MSDVESVSNRTQEIARPNKSAALVQIPTDRLVVFQKCQNIYRTENKPQEPFV